MHWIAILVNILWQNSRTNKGNQEKLMGLLCCFSCKNSMLVGSCFFSSVSVIFPPHIRPYTHAHISLGWVPWSRFKLFLRNKMISACKLGVVPEKRRRQGASFDNSWGFKSLHPHLPCPITPGTTHKSTTLKMSCKEERLPCLRLVAEVAADPTLEREFYGSSIPMERAHTPTMASLLTKAKAAKQAKIQRAAEARQ